MKSKATIISRGIRESILQVVLFPENDKENKLIQQSEETTLNEEDHYFLNELLTQICLQAGYSPIAGTGQTGNSFLYRVSNL